MSQVRSKTPKPTPVVLRQSMAWLHTWCGLWFSWLLYAVFLTGTLAVFSEPITHWMGPEHALDEAAGQAQASARPEVTNRPQRLAFGMAYMAEHHPKADMWELWPIHRDQDNGLVAYWFDKTGGFASMALDPVTGAPLPGSNQPPVRGTQGGQHFVSFHYELHAGKVGLWIVGVATMAMLVALVSGVVTHKRIFKDFFTFRPKKGQRSWLDAHNAVAVLSLPFLFMIAYTGLVISGRSFMPAPGQAAFAGQGGAAAFVAATSDPGKPVRIGKPLAVPHMEPFVARAEKRMGQKVRAVVIDHPGDASMRIGIYGWSEEGERTTRLSSSTGMVSFSAATGQVLQVRLPGGVDGGASLLVQQVMGDLHMASFGGWAVKWLYFVCGLAGTAMMATGAILFMVKRRGKHGGEFGAATAGVYRLVEGLNVAVIAGLAVACVAYLWANRLVPLGLPRRDEWEVGVFFAVWLLTLVHAFVHPPARAWVTQLWALAALCGLLPLLNWLTTGDKLWTQFMRSDWESAGVEITALVFGLCSAWAARHAGRKRQGKATNPMARPASATVTALAETESA